MSLIWDQTVICLIKIGRVAVALPMSEVCPLCDSLLFINVACRLFIDTVCGVTRISAEIHRMSKSSRYYSL